MQYRIISDVVYSLLPMLKVSTIHCSACCLFTPVLHFRKYHLVLRTQKIMFLGLYG